MSIPTPNVQRRSYPSAKIQHILNELSALNDGDLNFVQNAIAREIQCREFASQVSIRPVSVATDWNVGIDWGQNAKSISLEVLAKQIEKLCEENNCSNEVIKMFKDFIDSADCEELVKLYNSYFEDEFGKLETVDGKFFFTE